ncbi:hypothetical protein IU500_12610 [Nocardia terpenica]|uniref:hypothetical protein n=1 Tax=Nocardia terpenica TaxID=455432 RepID=UPI001893BB17|nr:hypothetical protein [Nocardia terpenica]MBF6062981.1 hypothetical protein [Nocardia terpenica]MBF6104884.1 hypothetical protein [Nocardia terpenica]MBF6112679.1 hypothetical protein [Nocardia terpenica]MBF6118612.1 hypothetical protein [Nocardia terpenica]MBF6155091.1 hypothetical protein [Nocardia terpenica]
MERRARLYIFDGGVFEMAAYEDDSNDDGGTHVWLELYDRGGDRRQADAEGF